MSKTKTYKIMVACSNCKYKGPLDVPVGREVPIGWSTIKSGLQKGDKLLCPKCGCETVSRAYSPRDEK